MIKEHETNFLKSHSESIQPLRQHIIIRYFINLSPHFVEMRLLWETWLRTLYDFSMMESQRRKTPCACWDTNPLPHDHVVSALPLRYNRGLRFNQCNVHVGSHCIAFIKRFWKLQYAGLESLWCSKSGTVIHYETQRFLHRVLFFLFLSSKRVFKNVFGVSKIWTQ